MKRRGTAAHIREVCRVGKYIARRRTGQTHCAIYIDGATTPAQLGDWLVGVASDARRARQMCQELANG